MIYTAHVHRRDGCDMGLFDDLHPVVANRDALVDGTPGADVYSDLAPAAVRLSGLRIRLDAECRGSSCDPRHTRDVDGPCDAGSGYGCPSGERPSLRGVSLARSLSGSVGRASKIGFGA